MRVSSPHALPLVLVLSTAGCASGGGDVATPPTTEVTLQPTASPTPDRTASARGPSAAPTTSAASGEPDDACRTDDDCTLENVSEATCCSTCGERAMTQARASWLSDRCRKMREDAPGSANDCPSIDCPYEPKRAACESGRCVARPRPTPKS